MRTDLLRTTGLIHTETRELSWGQLCPGDRDRAASKGRSGTDGTLAPKGSSGCRVQQEQPGRVPLCSGAPSKGLVLSLTVTVLNRRHAVWDCNGEEFPKERLVPLAFLLATPSPCKGRCYLRTGIKDNFVLGREGVQDCFGVCFFYQASRLVLLTQRIPEDKVLFSDFLELSHKECSFSCHLGNLLASKE